MIRVNQVRVVMAALAATMITALALIPGQSTLAAVPVYGVYFKSPVGVTSCTTANFLHNIPVFVNIPNDGAAWTVVQSTFGTDGTNSAGSTSPASSLSPTAGETPYAGGFLLATALPVATPGPLTYPFSYKVIETTYRDGVRVLISTAKFECNAGVLTFMGIKTRSLIVDRCGKDGRINAQSCPGPVALYCVKGELEVYWVDGAGKGHLDYKFSDWPEKAPAVNTILKQTSTSTLWALSSGEIQINAPAGEGKMHVFIFNGCPYDGGGYYANTDSNE